MANYRGVKVVPKTKFQIKIAKIIPARPKIQGQNRETSGKSNKIKSILLLKNFLCSQS